MDIKAFTSAITQIAEEKGISSEKVVETIEQAIASAYKKDYGKKGQIIRAKLNPQTGEVEFCQVKLVVDESMILTEEELADLKEKQHGEKQEQEEQFQEEKKVRFNPERHIMLDEAKKTNSKIEVGQEIYIILETRQDYGRIAAQTAKQVILQRIREAEREAVFGEYKTKEGEILSGIVQRIEGKNVYLDVGKASGILPKEEQVPGEFYRPGQRLKTYVLNVEQTPKGPVIFLSRAYPKLLSKLFELEVPEVSSGAVIVKSLAREAGSRSKIAVISTQDGVDPIGAMVGQRGTRVQAVINELGGEKIDIIEYAEDTEKYIANSLSPAKVLEVKILPKNRALCVVPEEQLSLAIGKDGQNVRLAAKLTGWKIDVRPPGQETEEKEEAEKEPEAQSTALDNKEEEKVKKTPKKQSKKAKKEE